MINQDSLDTTIDMTPEKTKFDPKATVYYVKTISQILNEIIEENEAKEELILKNSFYQREEQFDPFLGRKVPSIPIEKFLERIVRYTKLENSTLILSLIYIDRICEMRSWKLKYINIHRLLITSVLTALKYNEDDIYDNVFYSNVGGITSNELQMLEENFLKGINYTLFINDNIFEKYENFLVQYNTLK